ncbi:PREDICTED: putative RING-H2 finger protein ATL21A [Nelumbo nucifera]|uniref:RING-type E3 ubiquitin transferase n=1 Tax=Nelumbo nucifera TaxID=4432 RepID=A0A1U8PZY6_NELNU|nr:PREDICTED: putative RING-H2 finger protein ATL21A [Nelumbo nucifera]
MGGGGCRSSSRQPQVVPVLYLVLSLLPLILASAYAVANQDDCNVSNCKHHGPDIRFPFRLKEDRQHSRCGYAGLELSCTEKKETKLELPFSGAFLVKAIDYRSQLMETYDPQGCIIKRLLRLNFSASPFHQTPSPQLYYGDGIPAPDFVHFIIILNCSSTELIGKAQRVNCLEVSGYQVYAVHVSDDQWLQGYMPPPSCRKVRTISVPFSDHFLSHINDPDLSIFFSWKSPNCSYCEEKGKRCTWKNHTSGSRIQCLDIPTKGVSIGQVVTVTRMCEMISKEHQITIICASPT